MNERFRKLMEEASFGACYDAEIPVLYGHEPINEIETFAELIVRECAKTANDWYQNHDKIHSDPMSYVLTHFGVEE
jgi:hypothetical protein